MQWLRFTHVAAMVIWLGSAAGEFMLELTLAREKTASRQKALIDLHRIVDFTIEGPALLVTLATGIALIYERGYADHKWPNWLEDKVICGLVAAGLNLVCITFVFLRARRADQVRPSLAPLQQEGVRRWHYAVFSTFIGAPFAIMALWLAIVKP